MSRAALKWTDWLARIGIGGGAALCVVGAAGAAMRHDLFWVLFELLAAVIWLYNLHQVMKWPAYRAQEADRLQRLYAARDWANRRWDASEAQIRARLHEEDGI